MKRVRNGKAVAAEVRGVAADTAGMVAAGIEAEAAAVVDTAAGAVVAAIAEERSC